MLRIAGVVELADSPGRTEAPGVVGLGGRQSSQGGLAGMPWKDLIRGTDRVERGKILKITEHMV